MSLRGAEVRDFEGKLKKVFDRIDDELEDRWGERYPLHPVRPPRGTLNNKEDDGLFNVGASFSAGYGSAHGRGYVSELRVGTLAHVPTVVKEEMYHFVAERARKLLRELFPNRELRVEEDGNIFKIVGDLGLDRT